MASSELTKQLDLVRKVAHSQLATFARLDADACTESYLFKDDHFCGIKLVLGSFKAQWKVGQTAVEISRDGKVLQTVSLDVESSEGSSQRRAA